MTHRPSGRSVLSQGSVSRRGPRMPPDFIVAVSSSSPSRSVSQAARSRLHRRAKLSDQLVSKLVRGASSSARFWLVAAPVIVGERQPARDLMDVAGRRVPAERLRALRDDRQRLGVDLRPLDEHCCGGFGPHRFPHNVIKGGSHLCAPNYSLATDRPHVTAKRSRHPRATSAFAGRLLPGGARRVAAGGRLAGVAGGGRLGHVRDASESSSEVVDLELGWSTSGGNLPPIATCRQDGPQVHRGAVIKVLFSRRGTATRRGFPGSAFPLACACPIRAVGHHPKRVLRDGRKSENIALRP